MGVNVLKARALVGLDGLDGFRPSDKEPFAAFSRNVAHTFYGAVERLSQHLHVKVDGIDQVPRGRALLVANHSFGFDVVFALAAISERLNRRVWVLGEHIWWRIPFVRRLVASLGVVDGTPENLDRLLAADELVLVLPGGMREAVKPRELRYQLLWGRRYGFVRAAIRNQAPLVPLAGVGADELFDFVGNPFERGARWLGRRDLPVPLPAKILPFPRLRPLHFTLGEPVAPPAQPELAGDACVVRRLRREVEGALHELIEMELAQRLGMEDAP
jgi:1-acyl-sn-glycerol-3-phosphate acyltransferase